MPFNQRYSAWSMLFHKGLVSKDLQFYLSSSLCWVWCLIHKWSESLRQIAIKHFYSCLFLTSFKLLNFGLVSIYKVVIALQSNATNALSICPDKIFFVCADGQGIRLISFSTPLQWLEIYGFGRIEKNFHPSITSVTHDQNPLIFHFTDTTF